jgi:zinc protease
MSQLFVNVLQRCQTLRAVSVLCPALLFGCAHGGQAHASAQQDARSAQADRDAFRRTIPSSEAAPTLHLPVAQRLTLPNGLGVWILPKRDLPLVQVVALIKSGTAEDPPKLEGVASLTAEVMRRGTRSRSAHAIALEVENLGGSLGCFVEDDATYFEASALTPNIGPVLDVLADVLQHPSFDRSEFERAQKERLSELAQMQSRPAAIAAAVTRRVVHGPHPYGHRGLGTQQSVRAIHPATLATFYGRHVRPANTQIIIVGDVSPAEAQAMIEERLGSWHGKPGAQQAPVAGRPQERQIALVHRPEASQSQLTVCTKGLSRQDPDFYSAMLANEILGGLFNSRLNMNLREDKGWTYGVRSSFGFLRAPGAFAINTSIRTDATLDGIHEIFAEIERMRTEEISEQELNAAKNGIILSLPGNFESVDTLAGMVGNLALHQLPLTYYRDLPAAYAKVTPKDVLRLMRKVLAPEALSIVVVGDETVVEAKLAALGRGPVHHYDAEGQPLPKPSAAKPAKALP